MRRRAFLGAVLAAPTIAWVGLPTVTAAWARPRPVAPTVRSVPLRAQGGAAVRSLRGNGQPPALLSAPTSDPGFSMIGVTWLPDPLVRPRVEVRTRAGGAWSSWRVLEVAADHAPDGREAQGAGVRAGTAPLWAEACDGYQVRVDAAGAASPFDVRVELVEPGTSPADGRMQPRGLAHAAERRPEIITRAQWGADESIRRGSPSYTDTIKVGFVHHTASSNDYTPEQAAAMVRGIYAYHVKSNGWSDIGYNFLVDRYGRVYEGRAGGVDRYVLGAHTGGFNADSFGVALLGDFSSLPPSQDTASVLADVLAWKLGTAWRDPQGQAELTSAGGGTSRYPRGAKASFDVISGHRDAGSTSCPGSTTYGRLPALRAAAADALGAALVNPVLEGGPEHAVGTRATVAARAGTLRDLEWSGTVTDAAGTVLRRVQGVGGEAALSWDLTDAAGRPARPGRYVLTLAGRDGAHAALPWTADVIIRPHSCRGTPLERVRCRLSRASRR